MVAGRTRIVRRWRGSVPAQPFDASGSLGIRTEAGAHAIARKPAGCVVLAPQ